MSRKYSAKEASCKHLMKIHLCCFHYLVSEYSSPFVGQFLHSNKKRTFGTETVHITVGDDECKLTFTVHKNLIVSKSKFFSAMFDGNFLEAMISSASFPNDDPSAFEVLMEWVYYDSLKSLDLNSDHTQAEARENIRKVVKTLGLADKYCIDELADRCMTILYHCSRHYQSCQLDFDMIIFIYEETGPISMARKYAATQLAAQLTTSVPNLRARLNTGITTVQEIFDICKQNRDALDDLFKVISGSSRPRGASPEYVSFICTRRLEHVHIMEWTGRLMEWMKRFLSPQKTVCTVGVEGQGLNVILGKQVGNVVPHLAEEYRNVN